MAWGLQRNLITERNNSKQNKFKLTLCKKILKAIGAKINELINSHTT